MKRKIITKFLSTTLVATSIFSTSLTLPASANDATFRLIFSSYMDDINNSFSEKNPKSGLTTNRIDDSLIKEFKDVMDNMVKNYNDASDYCTDDIDAKKKFNDIKKECSKNELIQLLQQKITDDTNIISDNFKNTFKQFIKQIFDAASCFINKSQYRKEITIKRQVRKDEISFDEKKLKKIFNKEKLKNKLDENVIAYMKNFVAQSKKSIPLNEDDTEEIKKVVAPVKNLTNSTQSNKDDTAETIIYYFKERGNLPEQIKNAINDETDKKTINKTIKRLKTKKMVKDGYIDEKEYIVNYSVAIQFLTDCLNILKSNGRIDLYDYTISNKEYNDILNKHFRDACVDSELIKNHDDNIDGLNADIKIKSKVDSTSIDDSDDSKEHIELDDKITASKDVLQHIFVGDDILEQSTATLSTGHTNYSIPALNDIANKNYEKMQKFSNNNSLSKIFMLSTGLDASKLNTEKVEGINTPLNKDNLSKKYSYACLGRFWGTNKGIFPEKWTWTKISDAISNILTSNNLEYTKEKIDEKNNVYRYACFYGTYEEVPIVVFVNLTDKSLVTAYPLSKDGFDNNKKAALGNKNIKPKNHKKS